MLSKARWEALNAMPNGFYDVARNQNRENNLMYGRGFQQYPYIPTDTRNTIAGERRYAPWGVKNELMGPVASEALYSANRLPDVGNLASDYHGMVMGNLFPFAMPHVWAAGKIAPDSMAGGATIGALLAPFAARGAWKGFRKTAPVRAAKTADWASSLWSRFAATRTGRVLTAGNKIARPAVKWSGRLGGPVALIAANASELMVPKGQLRREMLEEGDAIRSVVEGQTLGAKATRIANNFAHNLDKFPDVMGTGLMVKNPWAGMFANGSTLRVIRGYMDALKNKGGQEEKKIFNTIYQGFSIPERWGGGQVGGDMVPQLAFERGINPEITAAGKRTGAGWDQNRFNAWRNNLRNKRVPEREILAQAEKIRKQNPLYFHSGVTDKARNSTVSEIFNREMIKERKAQDTVRKAVK